MLKTDDYYCAVRLTEGREWFDISTLSLAIDDCMRKADKINSYLGAWAAVNPIVRFVRVKIKEAGVVQLCRKL